MCLGIAQAKAIVHNVNSAMLWPADKNVDEDGKNIYLYYKEIEEACKFAISYTRVLPPIYKLQ